MEQYARLTNGDGAITIKDIRQPFSNFKYIEDNFGGIPSLRRTFSQVRRHEGQTMVVELLDDSVDIVQENEDIRDVSPRFVSSKVTRLSFFKKPFKYSADIANLTNSDFIGYTIIKSDNSPEEYQKTRIYESIIRTSRHANNCIRGLQDWPCKVHNKIFTVPGYIYAQQNGLTCRCCHVALRTILNRFCEDSEISYRRMNELVMDYRTATNNTNRPTNTIYADEVCYILDQIGISYYFEDYSRPIHNDIPFQKCIYGSVESGYPSMLIFNVIRLVGIHAIPVFGHTFNEDTWVQRAEYDYFIVGEGTKYIPSELWVSMYISHDDNFGSNYCIPRNYLYTRTVCDELNPPNHVLCEMENNCVQRVLGTLPKEVKVDPIESEVIGYEYLRTILSQLPQKTNIWVDRLERNAIDSQHILRPVLLTMDQYLSHLKDMRDWDYNGIKAHWHKFWDDILLKIKKQYIWMIELSVPELFPINKRKLGEVIILAEKKATAERDFMNFVSSRLPCYFSFYKQGPPDNPEFVFIPSGIDSHVPLYWT